MIRHMRAFSGNDIGQELPDPESGLSSQTLIEGLRVRALTFS